MNINPIKFLIDRHRTLGVSRSPEWGKLRDSYLKKNPRCVVCGKSKNLIVHHKKPFHIFPKLELDEKNLMTLCESQGMNCHVTFGHLGDFKKYNKEVDGDIIIWHKKTCLQS